MNKYVATLQHNSKIQTAIITYKSSRATEKETKKITPMKHRIIPKTICIFYLFLKFFFFSETIPFTPYSKSKSSFFSSSYSLICNLEYTNIVTAIAISTNKKIIPNKAANDSLTYPESLKPASKIKTIGEHTHKATPIAICCAAFCLLVIHSLALEIETFFFSSSRGTESSISISSFNK